MVLLLPVMITLLFKFMKFYLVRESNTVHRIAGYFSAAFSPVSRKVVFGFFFFNVHKEICIFPILFDWINWYVYNC